MSRTAQPDVSVVMAVYNTLPYLRECLDSLVDQTIGHERMEIVAVNDGSTDGSREELERYADKYPDLFTILDQENSGSAAAPSNRGMERAAGRYVFFMGSDDYLGRESLARMVDYADDQGSDVVVPKMIGVGGKAVAKRIFANTDPDVSLYDSPLPWAISNTKLFRLDHVREIGAAFPESMKFTSDQPFALHAMILAEKVSVLADYDHYFAVRREDDSNITYSVTHPERARCTRKVMDTVADLVEPGPRRDAVIVRLFSVEFRNALEGDFLQLPEDLQRETMNVIADAADAYFTDRIRDRLLIERRARIMLAQAGDLDALKEFVYYTTNGPVPGFRLAEGGVFAMYPSYGESVVPDRAFEVLDESVKGRFAKGVTQARMRKGSDGSITVGFEVPLSGSNADEHLSVVPLELKPGKKPPKAKTLSLEDAGGESAEFSASEGAHGDRTKVSIRLSAEDFAGADVGRWQVRVRTRLKDKVYDLPLSFRKQGEPLTVRKGVKAYSVHVKGADGGVLECRRVSLLGKVTRVARRIAGK
ncbi:glycosyltransferase family 2 protein [Salininema proteolyticum]|uniref:Glycosyltransferase family 2 protein n=1 Tax=Salininema proteolyticum TaxID=1607685 RepID=A0ABV8U308_9ACTN